MQHLHHEPPTALMRSIADALRCTPPAGRWSPGGVFLDDLADRYALLAARLQRHGEPGTMSAEWHADWFSRLAVDRLPTASICHVFADLQLWGEDLRLFDQLFRGILTERIFLPTVAFVENVGEGR